MAQFAKGGITPESRKEMMEEMKKEMSTFRLYQSIRFNRPIDTKRDHISPGGYMVKVRGNNGKERLISFDFEDYEGTIDTEDARILHVMQKNPDDTYEDSGKITAEMLTHITGVEEWFIYTGEDNETDILIPEEILNPYFSILKETGTWVNAPIGVPIKPVCNSPEICKYYLEGYDKDSDVYETICTVESKERLVQIGNLIAAYQRKTDAFRRMETQEPFDWFVGTDDNRNIYNTFRGTDDTGYRPIQQSEREEFIGQVIDIFEDFLDEKKVILKNPDRDASQDEDAANIYGDDYYRLETRLGDMFEHWRILEENK